MSGEFKSFGADIDVPQNNKWPKEASKWIAARENKRESTSQPSKPKPELTKSMKANRIIGNRSLRLRK